MEKYLQKNKRDKFILMRLSFCKGRYVSYRKTHKRRFSKAGCSVREERIYIPHYLVEETIKYTPRKFSMYDSYGKRFLSVGGEETSFGPGGFKALYLDWRDGRVKDSDYQGLADEAKDCRNDG